MGGQHNHDTSFGVVLEKIARLPEVETVVEIGTWDGQGSTLQLVKGLASSPHKKNPPLIITFEADPVFYEKASVFWSRQAHLLERVDVNIRFGRVSTRFAKWEDVTAHHGFHEQMNSWYEKESSIYHESSPFPVSPPVDFVVLDGGEYTTTGDWEVLEQSHPKFVAVNNCTQFKGEKVYASLSKSSNWKMIESDVEYNISWAVFEHVSPTPEAPTPSPEPAKCPAPEETRGPDSTAQEIHVVETPAEELVTIVDPVVIVWDDEDDDLPADNIPEEPAEIQTLVSEVASPVVTPRPEPQLAPEPVAVVEKKKRAPRAPKVPADGEKKVTVRRRSVKKKEGEDVAADA